MISRILSLVSKIYYLLFRRELSIKFVITLTLLLFFIFISTILIVTTYQLNRIVVNKVAHDIVDGIAKRMQLRIKFLFEPSKRIIKNVEYSGIEYGFFDPANQEEILNYFRNIVVNNEEITSLYYGNNQGDFYMVTRFPDGSISLRVVINDGESIKEDWTHSNPALDRAFPDVTSSLEKGYDPRRRGWYKEALTRKAEISWSDPYVFWSTKLIGITLSSPLVNENGEELGVLGVDFSLLDISDFINNLEISKTSKVFIAGEKDYLLAISGYSREETVNNLFEIKTNSGRQEAALIKVEQLKGNPNVKLLYEKYSESLNNEKELDYSKRRLVNLFLETFPFFKSLLGSNDGDFVVLLESDQGGDVGIISEIVPDDQFPVKIGILIPEQVILGDIENLLLAAGVLILLIGGGAFLLVLKLSNKLSLELSSMTKKIDKIRNFDLSVPKLQPSLKNVTEISKINESYENMRKSLLSFSKFVPRGIVKKLIQQGEEAKLEGHKRNISILFTDIANFTQLAEKSSESMLVRHVGEYFGIVSKIVYQHGGIIDKYIGDAVMALWGTENESGDADALNACLGAMHVLRDLEISNKNFIKQGKPPLYTRFGINSGEAIVGNIGSPNRLNYTAIGDSVNIASRLEPLNKNYKTQLLISETTFKQVQHKIVCRLIDKVIIRGKENASLIYEPIGTETELKVNDFDFLEHYHNGFKGYIEGNWHKASIHFNLALAIRPDDYHTQSLIIRCKELGSQEVPNWNGVFFSSVKKHYAESMR